MTRFCTRVLVSIAVAACGESETFDAQSFALSAGAATVFDEHATAFSLPVPTLDEPMLTRFFVGNSFFNQNWVSAPASVATRDGLGPLFNARSCSGCHFRDGRGRPPELTTQGQGFLLRISSAGVGEHGAPMGDSVYGAQLQDHAIPGALPEAQIAVAYQEHDECLADGSCHTLRTPSVMLSAWSHGEPQPGLRVSPRVAPHLVGLGLLEAVPSAALRALSDPEDRDHDGVSGRLNDVWDVANARHAVGRFGWKAEQPSVLQQTAAALAGDLGLTNRLFPTPNHTDSQADAARLPNGGSPEVSDNVLDAMAAYASTLAVPARRGASAEPVLRGGATFIRIGCAQCHVPSLPSEARPAFGLPAQTIHAFTDLALHDMGEALSDDRPAFAASGSEWRTPPLWGLGLVPVVNGHQNLLHDGRARDFVEAILWHGGEAARATHAFRGLSAEERAALVAFLRSI